MTQQEIKKQIKDELQWASEYLAAAIKNLDEFDYTDEQLNEILEQATQARIDVSDVGVLYSDRGY